MKPENLKCPNCDGPMVSRKRRDSGQRFWGCERFPDCTGTRDTDGLSFRERVDSRRGRDDIDERPGRRW